MLETILGLIVLTLPYAVGGIVTFLCCYFNISEEKSIKTTYFIGLIILIFIGVLLITSKHICHFVIN